MSDVMPCMWLWVCAIFTVLLTEFVRGGYCPSGNSSGPPRFTTDLNDEDYTYIEGYKPLLCCAEGYDTIKWYRFDSNHWTPLPYNWTDLCTPATDEDGQKLDLKCITDADSTVFRCELIKNGAVAAKHDTRLIVQHCRPDPKPPTLTTPFSGNTTVSEYGGNLTLHCTGEFGCCMQPQCTDLRIVMWAVMDDDRDIRDISPRYSVKEWHNADRTIKGANLTIANVNEVDTQRTFLCLLKNLQEPSVRYSLQISKAPDAPDIKRWIAIIGGSVVGGLIVIFLLSYILHHLYGPQIRLYFYMRTPCGKEDVTDEENFDHNAFVYLADEDQGIGEQIKEYLEALNYRVYLTTEITPGKPKMQLIDSAASRSAVVFFLYTENLLHDDLVSIFFYEFVTQRKKIVILEVNGSYMAEDAQGKAMEGQRRRTTELAGIASDDQDGHRANEQRRDEGTGACGIERSLSTETDLCVDQAENKAKDINEKDENLNKMVDQVDDIKFWKRLPKIQVHFDKNGGRKTKNFMCELQRRIPKFPSQEKQGKNPVRSNSSKSSKPTINRDRGSSSGRPLLDSFNQNTPNEAKLESPMVDQVFFDEVITNETRIVGRPTPGQNDGNIIQLGENVMATDQHGLSLTGGDRINPRADDSLLFKHSPSEVNHRHSELNDPDQTAVLKLFEINKTGINSGDYKSYPENPTSQELTSCLGKEDDNASSPDPAVTPIELNESHVGKRPSLKKGDSSDTSDLLSPSSIAGQFSYKTSVSSGFSEASNQSLLENSGKTSLENSGEHNLMHGESDSDYTSRQTNSLNNTTGIPIDQNDKNDNGNRYNKGAEHGRMPLVLALPGTVGQGRLDSEGSALSPESGYSTSRENSVQNGHHFPIAGFNNQTN